MKDTIDSLDKFLCNVGETFRNSDDSMANSIGQTMYTAPETGLQLQERYIQGGKRYLINIFVENGGEYQFTILVH